LLGAKLKSDFINDLFETYDVDVVYSYDRTHENIEDEYFAEIPQMGLEFIFDACQTLKTLFMKKVEHTGYNPFESDDPRNVPFKNGREAMKYAQENGIFAVHNEAKRNSNFEEVPEWVKFNLEIYLESTEFSRRCQNSRYFAVL
jgi:hypothetical protein